MSPGIDHQRVAEHGTALVAWREIAPALAAGREECLEFDGPGAAEDLPMIFSGLLGECGRQDEEIHAKGGEPIEQAGEP
ncbi:hypothetical protein D3C72_2359300 [compost metagenome]